MYILYQLMIEMLMINDDDDDDDDDDDYNGE